MKMQLTRIAMVLSFLIFAAACAPAQEAPSASGSTAISSKAAVSEISEYEYQTVEGGIEIIKYNGTELMVTVPAEIDGKPVVSIGEWAFSGLEISEATLPDTVTSIGWGAFSESEALLKITLPKNLTVIEKYAFSNCCALEEIKIPEGVAVIGYGAFSECSALKSIQLPASLKKIEFNTFAGCKVLTSIDIPAGVTEIEYDAFYKCNALSHIAIPASVTKIGENAFEECENLTAVCYGEYAAEYCKANGVAYIKG